jgi:hypothetical protein
MAHPTLLHHEFVQAALKAKNNVRAAVLAATAIRVAPIT